jgi:hypothetical protein
LVGGVLSCDRTWMYEDVNPHDSTKSLDVYLVPEGAQPEAWLDDQIQKAPPLVGEPHRLRLRYFEAENCGKQMSTGW